MPEYVSLLAWSWITVTFFRFQLCNVTPTINCVLESKETGPSIISRGYLYGHLLSHVNCWLLGCSSHCIRVILIPSICIDNVEVIIMAMACHIGLYLELKDHSSSQAASTSVPLSANSPSVQRLGYKLYLYISLLGLDSVCKLCSVLMLCPGRVKPKTKTRAQHLPSRNTDTTSVVFPLCRCSYSFFWCSCCSCFFCCVCCSRCSFCICCSCCLYCWCCSSCSCSWSCCQAKQGSKYESRTNTKHKTKNRETKNIEAKKQRSKTNREENKEA